MKQSKAAKPVIRVLKFGGTCLHPEENRRHTLARIMEEVEQGHQVVAVVSAMGRSGDPYATDTLDTLLPRSIPRANRERDALLCCGEEISASVLAAELIANRIPAVSLRGPQLGLFTKGAFGGAEIVNAHPQAIKKYLDQGCVVVAAGFQGVDSEGSLTTLGRGGSDTTAVALAAALELDQVFFFKDVEGLFSADPKIVPSAAPLPAIPYDEAAHLAYEGARVLHPMSADLAKQQQISIRVRSLKTGSPGTLVSSSERIRDLRLRKNGLFAVTCLEGIGQLRVCPTESQSFPSFPCSLFESLAEAGISLDMINVLDREVFFTVASSDVSLAAGVAESCGCRPRVRSDCAKVSLLGGGIHGVPGIMARILSTLAKVRVQVYQSVDTYTVISVLVDEGHAPVATRALHDAFELSD
ncbi:MAG: aspartate kinase [Planctomycetota bacterium]